MEIHGDLNSGNCLKVKFTADYLGLSYEWKHVDIQAGESRTAEFLARNPFGQVPVVAFDDGRHLAQSNAIIRYLARGSDLIPEDAFERAQMDAWLFWEQYSHEPYIAVCRFHMVYEGGDARSREAWRVQRGEAALDVMEKHLGGRRWLVGEALSVADISLLAYTRLAPEGGFDLSSRPALTAWIERCERRLGIEPAQRASEDDA